MKINKFNVLWWVYYGYMSLPICIYIHLYVNVVKLRLCHVSDAVILGMKYCI